MARVSLLSKDQVGPEFQEIYQYIEDHNAPILNIFKVAANCPIIGSAFMKAGNALIFNGSLPPSLRELTILRVGNLTGSTYEWTQHVPIGIRSGLTEEQVSTLSQWKDASTFSDQERAVLQYVDEVTLNIRVSEETFKVVMEFFTEEQVVELTLLAGYYGMIARILEAFEVELESDWDPSKLSSFVIPDSDS
ncbi:MAG TPA: carboxymuconolactone decarboxylase family protein [Candidatus Lokiarchaeia archaeon]|nr:carboxymuconolactone decarboxylase family protein [Candidatus Lokiarchaeia archaeon]